MWLEKIVRRFRKCGKTAQASGAWGEEEAVRFLRNMKFHIMGRNVRLGSRCELDIVAMAPDKTLIFVEVKTRKNTDFGRPIEAVHRAKQQALSRAAVRYLQRCRPKPDRFRFDVVEVVGSPGEAPHIQHIEHAFPLSSTYRVPL